MSTNGPHVSCHSIIPFLPTKEGSISTTYNLEGVSSLIINDGIFETIEGTKKPNCLLYEPTIPLVQQTFLEGFGTTIYVWSNGECTTRGREVELQ